MTKTIVRKGLLLCDGCQFWGYVVDSEARNLPVSLPYLPNLVSIDLNTKNSIPLHGQCTDSEDVKKFVRATVRNKKITAMGSLLIADKW